MTRTKTFVIGGLAVTTIAVGGLAASARHGDWGHGHGHGDKMGGMMGAVCKGNAAEMADLMLVRLEYKIKPTDAQKPAFDDLKTAARSAAAKAKAGCPAEPVRGVDGSRPAPKAPTERLAMMEAKLAAELDAVRTVRPAADKLFATLSDDQKKALLAQNGGGWRGQHGDDGRGGEGRHGGPRGGGDRGEMPSDAPQVPDKK